MRNKTPLMGFLPAVLAAVMIVLALAACLFIGFSRNRSEAPGSVVYPLVTVVREVDYEQDTVLFEDSTGHRWKIRGAEDWQVGDCAGLLMNDNGTSSVRDDTVIATRYSAWSVR